MSPRRIALVSDWFLPRIGGIERHMVELARGLRARGHEVEVVTATRGPLEVPELPGVPIVRLDCPLLPGWQTVFRPREAERLLELIGSRRYDLVHAHSIYSPLALAATHAARALRVPAVLTAHSLVRHALIPVFRALDYRLMWSSWPHVVTAVSEAVAADLRRASFVAAVEVLPNGLSLPEAPATREEQGAPVRIVSVLRLVARKRPLALLRAFARIPADRAARARCRLVVVGGGPLYDALRLEAQRLGVADRLELRGWCSPAEVQAELARGDVFALPTRKEAFGLAALEAAAVGLPVVTLRGSGAAELFTPGLDGLIAASDEALAAALTTLVDDAALRRRLGARARELAERYAWSGVLDRTLGLYRLAEQRARDRGGAALSVTEARPGTLTLLPGRVA